MALAGPTLMTPTLSYLAGVPGAAKPFIQVTFSAAAAVAGSDSEAAAQTTITRVSDRADRVLLECICSSSYWTAAAWIRRRHVCLEADTIWSEAQRRNDALLPVGGRRCARAQR